jgi:hypothetical protein
MRLPAPLIPLLLLAAACGTSRPAPSALPENIAADPRGAVGIIAPSPTSTLPTALRALGVPFRRLAHDDFEESMLDGLSLVVLDEGAVDDPAVPLALPRLFDRSRTAGLSLVVLAQTDETGRETLRRNLAPFEPRRVSHGIELVAPQRGHRLLVSPNTINADDLEQYAERTHQLARGKGGRAILAGNLDRPDSSAALLRVPYGKGTVLYVAFPLAARAAEGYAAEQRLLANLLSVGE